MSVIYEKLEQIKAAMEVRPAPIAEIKAVYRFSIKDSGEQLDIHIDNSQVQLGEAGTLGAEPICTIILSEADMLKLLSHELNTTIAYMMGSLKVEGKLGAALKLLEALGEYK